MPTRRARPLLGTLVDIRVDDADAERALVAIEAAFAEIATVHRLMSFHEHDSDVSRINRDASREPVSVDPRTREVIELALAIARASAGMFDPSIGADLVEWNLLPRPRDAPSPRADADWRDIQVLADERIACAKPLWIDLGGIAKGYAVDRAIERLVEHGIASAVVNAGGDLRRIGMGFEPVHVRSPITQWPERTLLLGEGAVASSGGYFDRARLCDRMVGPYVDGLTRESVPADRAATVIADRCAIADALTKIVISAADAAIPLLDAWNAQAITYRGARWQHIGRAA